MKIEAVLRELGIDYRVVGDEAWAFCPSHENFRTPSWSCNIRTGVHNCFSCGFSGNLAHLVQRVLNLSYPESVTWVNERAGWSRAHQWREDYRSVNFSPPGIKVSEADMWSFTSPPEDALESRNITAESASFFGIKWNNVKKEWILPIRDPFTHDLWGYQAKNDRTFRNYPAGIPKSRTLFGLDSFHDGSTAILVESPVDCARIHTAGKSGGLSGFGVQVSNKQLSLIQRRTDDLILALDADKPGVDNTARICSEYLGQFKRLRVFSYGSSSAKDPGDMTDLEIRHGTEKAIPALRWLRKHGQCLRVN